MTTHQPCELDPPCPHLLQLTGEGVCPEGPGRGEHWTESRMTNCVGAADRCGKPLPGRAGP